ncbi:hypothetical protein [Arsenicicoccus dermatophilus]|uniref:hypothetical protein n=1 Tax=Arsenicicoccus dermatophilus TaxID=1076331 RepID=UPI001F4CEF3F|nr:hypothetical protein [Arsenicicoccus dermatophilus]MCH8613569.1 hypothetical protein [Arsenicicoccus dermatophilus]
MTTIEYPTIPYLPPVREVDGDEDMRPVKPAEGADICDRLAYALALVTTRLLEHR